MYFKKGQTNVPRGSQAATLILIITGLIILYILFLPPVDRAELLGEPIPGGSGSGSSSGASAGSSSGNVVIENSTLLSVSPGKIDYSRLDEYEYDLPAFTLFKTTSAYELASYSPFSIRNGWFDKESKELVFTIADPQNTENVKLAFAAREMQGNLIIKVNGNEIYNYPITSTNPEPIEINDDVLIQGENTIEFEASPVGMGFWTTNRFQLEDVKIIADITDVSRQEARNTFSISQEEGKRMDRASLRFDPECNTATVGLLEITVNGRNVFSGVPDCGVLNRIYLSPSYLNIGNNYVSFRTEKGSYLIDQIQVKTELKEPVQPMYSFELQKGIFYEDTGQEERCGDVDGVCPDDCDSDADKDCCFEEYRNGYWCDSKTQNFDDRCVGYVESEYCFRCFSGYEDRDGDAASACEGMCGDDKDNYCPIGCSEQYDKDCCFGLIGDQFWCGDLPISGVDFTCKNAVSAAECENCPKGYEGEGEDPYCPTITVEGKEKLRSKYDISLKFIFAGGDDKEALIYVNGHEMRLETYDNEWDASIDDFVLSGTNTIRIVPRSVLYISRIDVEIDE